MDLPLADKENIHKLIDSYAYVPGSFTLALLVNHHDTARARRAVSAAWDNYWFTDWIILENKFTLSIPPYFDDLLCASARFAPDTYNINNYSPKDIEEARLDLIQAFINMQNISLGDSVLSTVYTRYLHIIDKRVRSKDTKMRIRIPRKIHNISKF